MVTLKLRYFPPVSATVVISILAVVAGCSHDPSVRRDKLIASAEQYYNKAQYDAASIQLRRAVQLDRRSAEAHYRLGLTYLKMGNPQGAYNELLTSLQLSPNHVGARLALAELMFTSHQSSHAREQVEYVLRQNSNNVSAHQLLGRIDAADKQYEEALRQFEQCQRLDPKNVSAIADAGLIQTVLRRYREAEASFQRAIDQNPSFVLAYLDAAQVYRIQNDSDDELKVLRAAIERNPKEIAPYLTAATAYVRQGRTDQVDTLFAQLRSVTADNSQALLAIGNFYFAIGDAVHGKAILSTALAKDSTNTAIKKNLIELELNQHEWDAAEKLNDELLKTNRNDAAARLFRARLQFARGANSSAISTLEQLVHDDPDMALAHFYLGVAYANGGESAMAASSLNDALVHDPGFVWAYLALGELHAREGNPKLALEFSQKALARNPKFLPAILLQSDAYIQMGEYEDATSVLTRTAGSQPTNPAVQERFASIAVSQKKYTKAEQHLERALSVKPDYVPALAALVRVYGLQKRPIERTIARVEQQIKSAPKESAFFEILGDLYFSNKELAKAEQAFSDAVLLNTSASQSRLRLAQVYAAEGKLPDAIRDAREITQQHPDFLAAYLVLGRFYEQAGAISEAEKVYQEALAKNGDFAPALNNLAWLYCEHGSNLDLALSLAQKAKAKLPNEPSVSDTLGWIQYRKGLFDSAAQLLQETAAQAPMNATYQYHLGMSLWKAGRPNDARHSLQRALQLNLSSLPAEEAQSALHQLNSEL